MNCASDISVFLSDEFCVDELTRRIKMGCNDKRFNQMSKQGLIEGSAAQIFYS